MLKPYLGKVERWLSDLFGIPVEILVESNPEVDGEALFAATEQMRLRAMEKMTLPQPGAVAAKRKVAAPASELIYGKSLKGNVIPMKELGLDSGSVTVEGEVFAVEHRELRSGASVACLI